MSDTTLQNATPRGRELVAVIDVGATSIRMVVAQLEPNGGYTMLESLQQAVALGKDTFTRGHISEETTEECVKTLRSFRRLLDEYRIEESGSVRAVATSAVREASNRNRFLDRVYIAVGIPIEVIDEREVNRLTYLAIQPHLEGHTGYRRNLLVICEVGGGSTELLGVRRERVRFSHSFHLGALRLRELLDERQSADAGWRRMLETQIRNNMVHVAALVGKPKGVRMILLGSEVRFAAQQLVPDWDRHSLVVLPVNRLAGWANEILSHRVEQVVRRYHLSFLDAETLGPTLLAYVRMANLLDLDEVTVCTATLRGGLLAELSMGGELAERFARQVVSSAIELGRRCHFDEAHASCVTELALQLFDALADAHDLSDRQRTVLEASGWLHDIGAFVSNRSHHKHSMYLIQNSDIFGLGPRDQQLVAVVSRYHRKALPRSSHPEFIALNRAERITVVKLAAILRVADALDRGHAQRIRQLDIGIEERRLVLTAGQATDLSLEQMALEEKAVLFRQVYGRHVILRNRET